MKPDVIAVATVLVVLALGALLVLWLQPRDPLAGATVQGLAGPLPAAVAPVVAAAPAASAAAAPPAPQSLSVYFDFDRAELRAAEAAKLEPLLGRAFKRIEAAGHADRIGPAEYNMKLSARRAAAVKAYLTARDVQPDAVHASAKGEREPKSGDGCFDMGPELRRNRALVECLRPDRRVEVSVVADL